MKLYLVRHGVEMGGDSVVNGFADVPLSPEGLEQSRALAQSMKNLGIKRIYSSDLTRAVQTAMELSKVIGVGIQCSDRLKPINLGQYQGNDFQSVSAEIKDFQDQWLSDPTVPIPGGDSFESFQSRNVSFFRELAETSEPDEAVAVFTHSRNCILMKCWSDNGMTPLDHGPRDILMKCNQKHATYETYQIDKTSNLTKLTNAQGQKGRSFSMRFIEPGLVRYEEVGDVLIQKPALDAMAQSYVGCPIFDRIHKDTSDKDFSNGKADGIVTRVWLDSGDGWYWLEGLVWDADTVMHMTKENYGLSCAYDVMKWTDESGTWHNIPYENEVSRGRYTHLAIVKNPRYEQVRIIANQGGNNMKLMFWKKDQKPEEKPSEVELVNAIVPLNGQDTPFEKVMELAAAEMKRQDELANAKKVPSDDEIVEIGGKRITVKQAKELAEVAMKNSNENALSDEHKDGKHKEKAMDSCSMCNSELANAKALEQADAAKKRAEQEMKNALDEKKRLEEMRASMHRGEQPKLPSLPLDSTDRLKLGAEQYGPTSATN